MYFKAILGYHLLISKKTLHLPISHTLEDPFLKLHKIEIEYLFCLTAEFIKLNILVKKLTLLH